jgi:hypothetical protein
MKRRRERLIRYKREMTRRAEIKRLKNKYRE